MTSKYSPDMCGQVIELMSQGQTKTEVGAALGVHPQTFRRWADPQGKYYQPEFAEAMKRAKTASFAWWVKKGRDNLMGGKDFNTPLFGLYMANMFGWRSASKKRNEEIEEGLEDIKRALGIAEQ
jgi:hypothetical protein